MSGNEAYCQWRLTRHGVHIPERLPKIRCRLYFDCLIPGTQPGFRHLRNNPTQLMCLPPYNSNNCVGAIRKGGKCQSEGAQGGEGQPTSRVRASTEYGDFGSESFRSRVYRQQNVRTHPSTTPLNQLGHSRYRISGISD